MKIDYERSFKKLVDQINAEHGWALDSNRGNAFDRGMIFAYESIKRLADKLEEGSFFDEEGGYSEDDMYEGA